MITGLAHLPRTPTSVRLTARRTSLWAPRDVRKDATGVLRRSGGGRHCPPSLDRRATVGPTGSAGPPSLPANRGVDQPSGTKRLGVDSRSSSGERRGSSGERRAASGEARARTRGESADARRERGREARARRLSASRGESADARRERGREARARTRGESADARRERGREARARTRGESAAALRFARRERGGATGRTQAGCRTRRGGSPVSGTKRPPGRVPDTRRPRCRMRTDAGAVDGASPQSAPAQRLRTPRGSGRAPTG